MFWLNLKNMIQFVRVESRVWLFYKNDFKRGPKEWTDKTKTIACLCVSQDSLDELEMDDYWKELENISHSAGGAARGEGGGEMQEEEQQKIPEGRRHGLQSRLHPADFTIPSLLNMLLHWFSIDAIWSWKNLRRSLASFDLRIIRGRLPQVHWGQETKGVVNKIAADPSHTLIQTKPTAKKKDAVFFSVLIV